MCTAEPQHPRLRYGYTVFLFVAAGSALIFVFSHSMILEITEMTGPPRAIIRFTQAVEWIIFVFATVVAILRAYRSRLAPPTTAAVSILMIVWFPIGTIGFIYWVGWVRKRERLMNPETSNGAEE